MRQRCGCTPLGGRLVSVDPRARAWLSARTSTSQDWPLLDVLAAKGGHRIAVIIPAKDEQATVGALVGQIRQHLMSGHHRLVDDLLVVDSDSIDATAAIATAAGARVLATSQIQPDIPSLPGKGEAMWRGVAATDADIIVFLDADLHSFEPHHVAALVGPLLADDRLELVKAAYARALGDVPEAGGRVTELVARPLINLHWPELAGVVQPLAGEYAVRREHFSSLPIPIGYGVEIALLLDTARTRGLDAIAQVDLGERRHRHHGEAYLGRMAAEIWQTALARLDAAMTASEGSKDGVIVQFTRQESILTPVEHDVEALERPPLTVVAERYGPALEQT